MGKIVIFGGSGFLGSHVADALTEAGHEVSVFDLTDSKFIHANQRMIIGNLLDLQSIKNAVAGAQYVYNFAAIAGIEAANLNPLKTIETNIIGNANILEACREQEIERFVFASTVYVYSDMASFYRASKQSSELIIKSYQKRFNLDFTILRYGSLYGSRANEFNFIRKIIEQAINEGKISRKGDGQEIRDYIHVKDAAQCSVDILSDTYKNQHVLIKGTQTVKVSDVLSMVKEMLNKEIDIEYLPERIEEHYQITPYAFHPQVAKSLVLKDYHDLGQGLLECIYEIYSDLGIKENGLENITKQFY